MSRTARLLSGMAGLSVYTLVGWVERLRNPSPFPSRKNSMDFARNQACADCVNLSALLNPSYACHTSRLQIRRPRPRQRHMFAGRKLHARLAHVPLAHTVAAAALGEIHVNVVLVVAVGAGAEHGGEARTGRLAQAFTKLFGHLGICQSHQRAVDELDRAHVERIR